MCNQSIYKIIELRSEDGETFSPGTAYENTNIRFSNMDFRGMLNDHPEGDKGLWNVKVVYFNLYQPAGMDSNSSIDIQIDEITSPFTLSSRPTGGLTLGTATGHIVNDTNVDGDVDDMMPVGFSINASEGYTQTCRISFSNWNVRLMKPKIKDPNYPGEHLTSTTEGNPNEIEGWNMRLQLSPARKESASPFEPTQGR